MDKQTFLKNLENNTFKKKHYSQATIETISQSNLQQLVFWYRPECLTYKHERFFITNILCEEEEQIVLYDNMAYNHYSGESYPSIWFLQELMDLTFQQAVHLLNYFYYKVAKAPLREELHSITNQWGHGIAKGTNESLDLSHYISEDRLSDPNTKETAMKRAIAYLTLTRGIDRDIVLNVIKHRFLVMDKNNNLCFVTYKDPFGKSGVIAITKKGTLSTKEYKCNIVKEHGTGFFYARKGNLETETYKAVYVFESIIDTLSFLTLIKQGRISLDQQEEDCCFISLNGANNQNYLDKVLGQYSSIETVFLCLDNDPKGIKAAEQLAEHIGHTYSGRAVVDLRYLIKLVASKYNYSKDYNDVLKQGGLDFIGEI